MAGRNYVQFIEGVKFVKMNIHSAFTYSSVARRYNCTVSTAAKQTSKELDDLVHDLDGYDRMPDRKVEVISKSH